MGFNNTIATRVEARIKPGSMEEGADAMTADANIKAVRTMIAKTQRRGAPKNTKPGNNTIIIPNSQEGQLSAPAIAPTPKVGKMFEARA